MTWVKDLFFDLMSTPWYTFAMIILHSGMLWFRKDLIEIGKGYNGKWQKEEVTWVISVYFLMVYGLRITLLDIHAQEFWLAAILAGCGIAVHYSQRKKSSEPPKGLD